MELTYLNFMHTRQHDRKIKIRKSTQYSLHHSMGSELKQKKKDGETRQHSLYHLRYICTLESVNEVMEKKHSPNIYQEEIGHTEYQHCSKSLSHAPQRNRL